MKKYFKRSKILSIIFYTLLYPMAPAKAFVFENYWENGIMAWCQAGCGSYYYWYERLTEYGGRYSCNGAEYGCGSTNGASIRIKFVNGSKLVCNDLDLGTVPAHGRMRLLPQQVFIFEKESDNKPSLIKNLDGPGILCK